MQIPLPAKADSPLRIYLLMERPEVFILSKHGLNAFLVYTCAPSQTRTDNPLFGKQML